MKLHHYILTILIILLSIVIISCSNNLEERAEINVKSNELLGSNVENVTDYRLKIVEPDSSIDYKIQQVKPDSNTEYSMIVVDPEQNTNEIIEINGKNLDELQAEIELKSWVIKNKRYNTAKSILYYSIRFSII